MTASVLERVRAILAEAGYPDARVWDEGDGRTAILIAEDDTDDDTELVPVHLAWWAMSIAGVEDMPCWQCWRAGRPDCTHG